MEQIREAAQALIGSLVRSFDFDGQDITGERACYVTGRVIGILTAGDLADDGETVFHDCDRYIIVAQSRTFAGKLTGPACEGQKFFPPVNGTPSLMGGIMEGVVPVNRESDWMDMLQQMGATFTVVFTPTGPGQDVSLAQSDQGGYVFDSQREPVVFGSRSEAEAALSLWAECMDADEQSIEDLRVRLVPYLEGA